MDFNKESNQCYKCTQLLDNLNIEHSSSNSAICMWNKYQIFLYEDFNFKSPAKVFTPEYQVHLLLLTKDYFLCLDINGNVHLAALKLKNNDQKIFKCTHQPRDQGIKTCVSFSNDQSLSLKYESKRYYLCLRKINSNYKEVNKVLLNFEDQWLLQDTQNDKYFLAHRKIDKLSCGLLQKMFNTNKLSLDYHFAVISFDRHTLYGCLFNQNQKEHTTELIKLYSCPSAICSVDIIGSESTYLLIGLKMGTVIQLTLNDLYTSNSKSIKPEVVHLNSALHKFIIMNETLLYTDGMTMWKAENVFSKNATFTQFFVRQVKDFILCEDKIICTTFTKMIYTFSFEADISYLKPEIKEYSPAEEILKNTEYLNKIFQEVEKGRELSKKLSIEGSYIAAMSLSRRQEIMHKVINTSIAVYGSFEEVLRMNNNEMTLTEDMSEYINPSVYMFHITAKIDSEVQGGLFDIVSDILANSETELQVTLSNEHRILKTTSIPVSRTNFLIPLHLEDNTEIYINICLVAQIPGTYDREQKIWSELYRKDITVSAEHFIRAISNKFLFSLKGWTDDFEKSIMLTSNMDRKQFEFINTSQRSSNTHVMYMRMPQKFNSSNFCKYFSRIKSQFMIEMLSTEEFLQSKSEVTFKVGKEVVAVGLENDGFTNPRLKVMSGSLKVTASVRDFFSNIIYGENICKSGEEFIKLSFYTSVENLQKEIKNCIKSSVSFEEFAPLKDKFEKEIIGMLPV